MNPADPTSSSLLRRAIAREPDAWERLVSLYSPLVHHWCRQWGIAQHEVADVTQEVFAAVASSLGQFRPDQPGTTFRSWMRGITRHKLLHHASSRGEPAIGGTDAQVRLQQVPAPADEVELSESPADVTGLYQRALRLVQHQVEDRTWTAFWTGVRRRREPVSQIEDNAGKKTALRHSQQETQRVKAANRMHQRHGGGDQSPRHHQNSQPPPRPHPLQYQIARHLEEEISHEEYPHAQPVSSIVESKLLLHLQRSEPDIDPVEIAHDVQQKQEWHDPPRQF